MSPKAMLTMRAEYEPDVPTWQPRRSVVHHNTLEIKANDATYKESTIISKIL